MAMLTRTETEEKVGQNQDMKAQKLVTAERLKAGD